MIIRFWNVILSLPTFRPPFSRVFRRIPRKEICLYDNKYAGRVVRRCLSTQHGSYWWPRRKVMRGEQLPRSSNGQSGPRGYSKTNGNPERRKVYNFPKGFDFAQSFPDRAAREAMKKKIQSTLDPPPKKGKTEVWTTEDLQIYRKHFGEEDVVMLNSESIPRPATSTNTSPSQSDQPSIGEIREEAGAEEESNTFLVQKTTLSKTSSTSLETKIREDAEKSANSEGITAKESQSISELNSSFALSHEDDEELERALQHFGLGRFNTPFRHRPWHPKRTDLIQPQSSPITTPEPASSDPALIKSPEDVHIEHAVEPSSARSDMSSYNPEEDDEELVRALQHFNLGMEHIPWIPRPKQTWAELMKEYKEEKARHKAEKAKQLQLEEDKSKFNSTIHILGLGTQGKYIAHALAGLPHGPPITLLMHRPRLIQQWHDEGAAIRILANGKFFVQAGFNIESSADFEESAIQRVLRFGPHLEHSTTPPTTPINTLIVTTDAHTTLSALSRIRTRLQRTTTICFISDGLGIIEKINQELFPDSHERPTYVLGRMTHRLASTERHFTIVERKPGEIICSKLPQITETKDGYFSPAIKRKDFHWSPQAQHLLGTLTKVPELNTKSLGHKSFFASQLEKVVLAATIGPLSVAFDCSNDKLLNNFNVTQNMRLLLEEMSRIIMSFPELATFHTPQLHRLFSAVNLEKKVVSCIKNSGSNQSSMLQDVRAGDRTEIDFSVGYMISRARELGIACPKLIALLQIVKGKQAIKSREKNGYIPFEGDTFQGRRG